jgi:hypothetical protein
VRCGGREILYILGLREWVDHYSTIGLLGLLFYNGPPNILHTHTNTHISIYVTSHISEIQIKVTNK